MKVLRSLVLVLAGLVTSKASSTAIAENLVPMVYSGIFHNDNTQLDYLVRIHFIDVTAPGEKKLVYNAVVIFHLGDEKDPEYGSMNYDRIGMLRQARQVTMPGLQTANADHLPIIHLTFDESGQHVTGDMTNREQAGVLGHFRLTNGWDFHSTGPVVQPLGGLYDVTCSKTNDGSSMQIKGIDILPARFEGKSIDTEFALNSFRYRGSGICQRSTMVNCFTITSGRFQVMDDKLELAQGNWRWECDRRGPESLSCLTNVRYAKCSLRRRARLSRPLFKSNSNLGFTPLRWETAESRLSLDEQCRRWNGDFLGLLTHRLGGKQQAISIQLRSSLEDGEDGKPVCSMIGSGILHFYTFDSRGEQITFAFAKPVAVYPDTGTVRLADSSSDLILQMRMDENGTLSGLWGSRIYGFVGEWYAEKTKKHPVPSNDVAVYGVSGLYRGQDNPKSVFAIVARRLGASVNLLNPFGSIQLTGWHARTLPNPASGRGTNFREQIGQTYFDYFTNFLAFYAATTLYSGQVTSTGLAMHTSTSVYMSVANQLDNYYFYKRTREQALQENAQEAENVRNKG